MPLSEIFELLLILISLSPTTSPTSPDHASCTSIRDLAPPIRPMLDFKTASTSATSIVNSTLDYFNSLFLNLDSIQIQRLQLRAPSLCPHGPDPPFVDVHTR